MLKYLSSISYKIYLPVVYIAVGVLAYFIFKKIIDKIFDINLNYIDISKRRKKTLSGLFANIIKYIIALVVLISILNVFAVDTKTLLAGFGILGLVIGFALQDILKDFISGLFIIFDNKYDVGDVVNINNYRGEVIFLGLKSTRIRSIDGDIKIILNRNITEVINYSLSSARVQIDVSISNDYELLEVEKKLNDIIERVSDKVEHIVGDIMLLGVNKVDMLSTTFRVVVRCNPTQYTAVQRQLLKYLKIELDKEKIKIISLVGEPL